MKLRERLVPIAAILLCAIVGSATSALADNAQRDPLRALRRALAEAGAATLTTTQESQLNTLITAFQDALPDEPDTTIETARTAFNTAVLAGDLTAATAQAAIIANRTAALANAQLIAEAKFEIGVLAVLQSGGQLDLLKQKFGNDRVLALVDSLAGHPFDGGPHGFGSGPR